MESEKQSQHKDESSSSDPAQDAPKPSKPRKHGFKKPVPAESSEDERDAEAMEPPPRDNNAADFGNAGAWPVNKSDSAGAPVRREPEPMKVEEKKEKRKKKHKTQKESRGEIRDHREEKKEKQQPQSSDNNNKPSKEGTEECTTKRNLHMIRTEDSVEEKEEERKRKKRSEKKISKKKKKKTKRESKEKIRGEEVKQTLHSSKFMKKKEVELASIHIEKEPPARPIVERAPIKTAGHHVPERQALENIIPQYDNLPETTLMRQLKPKPVDPNRNPFNPHSEPMQPMSHEHSRTITITEPGTEKKVATEREKKEQPSTNQEWSMVTEKESNTTKFKRAIKNPPCWIWLVLMTFVLLTGMFCALSISALRENQTLREANQALWKEKEAQRARNSSV